MRQIVCKHLLSLHVSAQGVFKQAIGNKVIRVLAINPFKGRTEAIANNRMVCVGHGVGEQAFNDSVSEVALLGRLPHIAVLAAVAVSKCLVNVLKWARPVGNVRHKVAHLFSHAVLALRVGLVDDTGLGSVQRGSSGIRLNLVTRLVYGLVNVGAAQCSFKRPHKVAACKVFCHAAITHIQAYKLRKGFTGELLRIIVLSKYRIQPIHHILRAGQSNLVCNGVPGFVHRYRIAARLVGAHSDILCVLLVVSTNRLWYLRAAGIHLARAKRHTYAKRLGKILRGHDGAYNCSGRSALASARYAGYAVGSLDRRVDRVFRKVLAADHALYHRVQVGGRVFAKHAGLIWVAVAFHLIQHCIDGVGDLRRASLILIKHPHKGSSRFSFRLVSGHLELRQIVGHIKPLLLDGHIPFSGLRQVGGDIEIKHFAVLNLLRYNSHTGGHICQRADHVLGALISALG